MAMGTHPLDWAQNTTGPMDNVDPSRGDCYSAHHLSATAAAIVDAHPPDAPLFIYMAFQSVHSPYEAPQRYVDMYAWMNDTTHYTPISPGRPLYGGMVAALDEGVGNVTAAFRRKGGSSAFWDNTLLVFTTDVSAALSVHAMPPLHISLCSRCVSFSSCSEPERRHRPWQQLAFAWPQSYVVGGGHTCCGLRAWCGARCRRQHHEHGSHARRRLASHAACSDGRARCRKGDTRSALRLQDA